MRNFVDKVPLWRVARNYNLAIGTKDIIAAIVVTIMLIPQSLAYAILAGLPPEVGLYASILPLALYAVFGTSSSLSVGPVAIASMMTATALNDVAIQGDEGYLAAAITLAALSGGMLSLAGILRLGFLSSLLSYPVVSGFITASAIVIAINQLDHVLGVDALGDGIVALFQSLIGLVPQVNLYTLGIGIGVILFLLFSRKYLPALLVALGMGQEAGKVWGRTAPIVAVSFTTLLVSLFNLDQQGVATVGNIPAGLPALAFPQISFDLIQSLLAPAFLISIIGYVESISVGRTLGAKKGQQVDPNQELLAMGVANIGSSISGAFPVTGGFSRSVVNFDAGAETQFSSIYAALLIALVAMTLTPALYYLPKATLAATIIVAVLTLVDFSIIKSTWRYSKSDSFALLATLVSTLYFGVERGIAAGIAVSVALHLYKTSQPHIAEIGLVAGTEHFRNKERYVVQTVEQILSIRMDESLFFTNATSLESIVYGRLAESTSVRHVIILCSAINEIDFSALEALERINQTLKSRGIQFHLSEVKGPVLDRLSRSTFLEDLSGEIFISQFFAQSHLVEKHGYQ